MNLPGIPFELILIVLFFVLPALGNLQRRFRGRGGQQGEADTPTERERRQSSAETSTRTETSTRPQTGAPSRTPTQASTQTSTQTQPRAESGGPRWLEEAQRRVREAQQGEDRRSTNPRTDAQRPRTPSTLFKPAPKAQPAARPVRTRLPTSLEGPASEVRSLEAYRPEHTSLESSSVAGLGTAPPLRVQRLGAGKRATLKRDKLRFDASTLMNGVAWHQVLSPPLSKRRTRLSQRRP